MKDKRQFFLIHPTSGELKSELSSRTPREAALKAVTANVSNTILLVETGKLHIFEGEKIPIDEAKQNDFTKSKGILTKPSVRKLTLEHIDTNINPKQENGRKQIIEIFNNLKN